MEQPAYSAVTILQFTVMVPDWKLNEGCNRCMREGMMWQRSQAIEFLHSLVRDHRVLAVECGWRVSIMAGGKGRRQ